MCGQPRSQRRRHHSPSSGMTRLWGREQFPLESADWRAQWTFDYRVEGDRGVLEKSGPEPMRGRWAGLSHGEEVVASGECVGPF